MDTEHLGKGPLNALVVLRIFIGWHFLYEGIFKLHTPNWTAKGYLLSAEGFLSPIFSWLASDSLINIVDFFNIACMIVIGLALVLGYFERLGAILGVALLLLFYFAHPAFPGLEQLGADGNFWFINKNLVEAAALLVLFYLPTGDYFGIKRLFGTTGEPQTTN